MRLAKPARVSLKRMVEVIRTELLEYETSEVVGGGMYTATFSAGMGLTRIEALGQSQRLDVRDVPAGDEAELRVWVSKVLKVQEAEIKWLAVRPQNDGGNLASIVFKADEAKARASANLSKWTQREAAKSGHGADAAPGPRIKVSERESFSRSFTLATPSGVGVKDVHHLLGQGELSYVDKRPELPPQFTLVVRSYQRGDEQFLRDCLPYNMQPSSISIHPPKHQHIPGVGQIPIGGNTAFVQFTSRETRDAAGPMLAQGLSLDTYPINVISKKSGKLCTIPAVPQVLPGTQDKAGSATFKLIARDRQAAERVGAVQNLPPGWVLQAEAKVTVKHPEVFPDLDGLIKRTADKYGVSSRVKWPQEGAAVKVVTVFFGGGEAHAVGSAAAMLATTTTPARLNGRNDKQRALYEEVIREGHLAAWSRQLGFVTETGKYGQVRREVGVG